MIATDCPDADFTLLKTLLPTWPQNLEKHPALFSSWSMGDDPQPALGALMSDYYTPDRTAAMHCTPKAVTLRMHAAWP